MAPGKEAKITDDAPQAQPDRLAQLSAADVLNVVSKAAQTAARSAASNDVREGFIAFNQALIDQFGGTNAPPVC